jgi:ribosome biogenesis GTPase
MNTSLQRLGWADRFESAFPSYLAQGLEPARVAREDRDRYSVLTAAGECLAEVAGRFRHEARRRAEFPTVGDWVAARVHDPALAERPGHASIHAVLPRASLFARMAAGEVIEEQLLAANIDTALLVTTADGDLNPRRLERYLAAAWESGAVAAVVLNKADLATDADGEAAAVAAALGVPVVAVSAQTGVGLERLAPWIAPGKTVALLGSSGVGKSTLVNALIGSAVQETGAVREIDQRGRHTTTSRQLVVLPGGGILIDTPGMREFALWGGEEGIENTFADVESVAAACRFHDCTHESEPGCAVNAALADGTLASDRLESWRKLQREVRFLESKTNRRLHDEQRARWKSITKAMRNDPRVKRARS